jgi:putative heme transporter
VALPVSESDRVPSWLATAAAWTGRLLILVAGTVALLYVAKELAIVTVPIIIAVMLTTLAAPPVDWLRRRGVPPAVAAFLVVAGGVGLVAGLIGLLAPAFIEQTRALGPTLVASFDQLMDWIETGPLAVDREDLNAFVVQALAGLQEEDGLIASWVARLVASTLEAMVALVLSIVLLFFLVKDRARIVAWMFERVPPVHRPLARASVVRGWAALVSFVRGTALVATIDAVGIGLGLLIVGVPLVLPLALLVFIGAFVPVVGAAVTGLLAVLVALADGGPTQALIVLTIVVVVQQVESDVLQPMIMRPAVPLHPMVVLLVLTAGATLVGIVGAFLAVPIAAVVSAVANEIRLRHEVSGRHGSDPLGGPSGLLYDPDGDPPGSSVVEGTPVDEGAGGGVIDGDVVEGPRPG